MVQDPFSQFTKVKNQLQSELQAIDQLEELQNLPKETFDKRAELKSHLLRILEEEEILWNTRAKQRWLKEGDGNTKFFHAFANGRKRSNTIVAIEDDFGQQITNEELKRSYFYHSFKRMFGNQADEPSSFGDWSRLYHSNRLLDPDSLTTPFTLDEIKAATFQLGSDKAPGPNGFPLIFFQTFWEVVKADIFEVFTQLHEGTLSTDPIDYSFLCLIPKKEGANKARDFRPISLINGIQKIISKVLTNRLALKLPSIISSTQSAFLKDRLLTDSFVTASELVNWCSKSGRECTSIKVDFAKAFDNVRWPFLKCILHWLGFSDKWWAWIEQCICNAKIAILVNDVPTHWLKPRKGLRQGDPLSPYLFILVADCLARLTETARINNQLQGIGPSVDCKTVLLQYADDTIFFCEPRKRFMHNLLFLWNMFEWASGLSINKEKSELFYLGPYPHKATRLANILGCRLGRLPLRYLGLPLHNKHIRKEDWTVIINRVEARIEGWKAKLLSQGGRLTLVNSVLTNLPLFYFFIFRAPKWVLNRIEGLRRAFFWKGCSKITGGACLVNWNSVCKSKREGGLGILELKSMNLALITKWWWRYFTNPDLPWCKLITSLYYVRRKPLLEGRTFVPYSQWWKSVLYCRDAFSCGVTYELGDGRNIRIWSDIWIGETPLRTLFPIIFSNVCNKEARISQCWNQGGWRWRFICRGFTIASSTERRTQLSLLKDLL